MKCQGKTASGKPCNRTAAPGERTCIQHRYDAKELPSIELVGTKVDLKLKLGFWELKFRDPINNMVYEVAVLATRSKRLSFHVTSKKPYDQTDDGPVTG